MTTNYTLNTHPATLCTVDDVIAHILPKLERYVHKHYFDLSYDLQQELIQAGIIGLWEDARHGKLKTTDHPRYWMTACKTGVIRAMEDIKRETGVRVKTRTGETYVENRIEYECDLVFADSEATGLEKVEQATHRYPGHQDPDGGKCDQRIDFEWLLTKAFSLLSTSEVEDCALLAQFLAEGEGTGVDFRVQHEWTQTRYYKTFDRLKDVFYTAAGKERPAKQQNAATVDSAKVLALYQQGYGCQRIARLVGCSDSRADQIIQAAKR